MQINTILRHFHQKVAENGQFWKNFNDFGQKQKSGIKILLRNRNQESGFLSESRIRNQDFSQNQESGIRISLRIKNQESGFF